MSVTVSVSLPDFVHPRWATRWTEKSRCQNLTHFLNVCFPPLVLAAVIREAIVCPVEVDQTDVHKDVADTGQRHQGPQTGVPALERLEIEMLGVDNVLVRKSHFWGGFVEYVPFDRPVSSLLHPVTVFVEVVFALDLPRNPLVDPEALFLAVADETFTSATHLERLWRNGLQHGGPEEQRRANECHYQDLVHHRLPFRSGAGRTSPTRSTHQRTILRAQGQRPALELIDNMTTEPGQELTKI